LPFTAQAGTYERTDSTITFFPTVAKNPAAMAGRRFTSVARVRGDTLWSTSGARTGFRRWTWIRVERP
jgi:hypothetical protein